MKERVLVAMSGGVDSAVAAARLLDEGHEVVGMTLHLWDYPEEGEAGSHGRCCAPEDQYDARRMAFALGFAHFSFDRRELFEKTVVRPFVDAYLEGDTPSPCTICNREVKLHELFTIADRLRCTRIATGHYARIGRDDRGHPILLRGVDREKDQSYFLYASPRAWLERLVFPLGESVKPDVRAEAVRRNLPGATKGESQELCFVGAGKGAYARFVEERAEGRVRPGAIVDADGREVGRHDGVHRFTVGQRKGIGVALGEPAFVTEIDAASATVHLGRDSGLGALEATIDDVHLHESTSLPLEATARVRYRHSGVAVRVEATGARSARVRFLGDASAVTSGQIAVLYDGERVLGGGRITRVDSTRAPRAIEPAVEAA
ncbi:tRNA 2-thiouridine(34) synthase MnmA [soil metagenome]